MTEEVRLAQDITPVRVNEVSAANGIYVNEYWKRNDWIELYNTTDQPIDVEGMYLTDNLNKPHKYQISKEESSAETIIPPHGRLVVWCDKLTPAGQLHTSFKLADEGGDIMLSAADDSWSDVLTYVEHQADQTVGRYPDGTNDVYVMNVPSIRMPNIKSSYLVDVYQPHATGIRETLAQNDQVLTVRYVLDRLVVRGSVSGMVCAELFNLSGQSVGHVSGMAHDGYVELIVDQVGAGCHVARVTDSNGHTTTCKFISDSRNAKGR